MIKHVFDILLDIFLHKIAELVISKVQARTLAAKEKAMTSCSNEVNDTQISLEQEPLRSDYLIGLEDFEAALGDIVEGLTKAQKSGLARRYLAIQYIQAWINLSISIFTLAKRHLTITAKRTVKIDESSISKKKIE